MTESKFRSVGESDEVSVSTAHIPYIRQYAKR
jgi:hypothetical protein